MKNSSFKKSVLVIALAIAPLMNFASGFPFVKLEKKADKVLTLKVGSAQSESVKIALKDAFGQILYSETITNSNGILKRFDLQNLASGHYRIELENTLNIEILPIKVNRTTIEFDQSNFSTFYKPFFKHSSQSTVEFNLLNLNTENTAVIITDDKGKVIFKESLGNSIELKKRYDLSSLTKGTYYMHIQKGNRNFEHTITI